MQVLAALVAVAAAVPLEDTMDVKEAKAMFYKAFEEAEMGKLAEKQEMQIPHSKTCNIFPCSDNFLYFLLITYKMTMEVIKEMLVALALPCRIAMLIAKLSEA